MTHDTAKQSQLKDLERRLAEAKGGEDADLDEAIFRAAFPHGSVDTYIAGDERKTCWHVDGYNKVELPRFVQSLDAAVSLTERVLPGFARGTDYNGEFNDGRRYHAFVRGPGFGRMTEAFGPNDALALCLACVRALIAQGEK